jgi:hypothetical protein
MLFAAFCAPPVTLTIWNRAIWIAWVIAMVGFWALFLCWFLQSHLHALSRLRQLAFGFPVIYVLSLVGCLLALKLKGYAF